MRWKTVSISRSFEEAREVDLKANAHWPMGLISHWGLSRPLGLGAVENVSTSGNGGCGGVCSSKNIDSARVCASISNRCEKFMV